MDLILPAYNPESGWEQVVVAKYQALQALWPEMEIHLYVVDDGSICGFDEYIVDYLRLHIPVIHILSYPNNQGKGFALRQAVSVSHSDYCIYTDHDFPYTLCSMSKVVEALLQGTDVLTNKPPVCRFIKIPEQQIITQLIQKPFSGFCVLGYII